MAADKEPEAPEQPPLSCSTTEYCAKLQQWMWQYYWSYSSWHSWGPAVPFPFFPPPSYSLPPPHTPGSQQGDDNPNWYNYHQSPAAVAPSPLRTSGRTAAPQAGREYTIPSPLQRLLAETVDFFILFCVKATIVLWVMHLMGMKDIAKYITQFIVEEIDENTSMEDLQKMMVVALVYRFLVCVYETICIWGAGGATPGKFLLGLRVVTCDTCTLVRPNCVLVVPASNVSFSASAVRALTKNFSIAFLFPIFITLLFFQHNRTVFDLAAGTIVVQHRGGR
ncbi:protein FAM8A1 [Gouania willdenowi]|uniref:protein FAM8A1 n=1 Tax=Gouania willdenowi TaxID=441366 RepID=UPI0010565904|nr:protein FAM8A1 [Gouania willdenowi]